MKTTIKLCLFLFILGALSAAILASVDLLTKDKIRDNQEKSSYAEVIKAGLVADTIKVVEDTEYMEGINKIYQGDLEDGTPCYAFSASSTNNYTTVNVIVVIEISTKAIVNIQVLKGATTHGSDAKFIDNNFGIKGLTYTQYNDAFTIVTGATISSNSVKKCVDMSFRQFEILKGGASIISAVQKLPNYNEYIYVFSSNNVELKLLLTLSEITGKFTYTQTLEGEANRELIAECVGLADNNLPGLRIKTVSEDSVGTNVTVLSDEGHNGSMEVKVTVIDGKMSKIEVVKWSDDYADVPGKVLTQYNINPELGKCIVTGATYTSTAIYNILTIVKEFLTEGGVK